MTKNKLWRVVLTVFITGLLASCGDDDNNPFAGVDNNVLSFSLSQGEETWQGAIVDDKIVVSVPQGTELNGATAHYTISEQATILPDPASISTWNEEQQLTVTSYNGKSRTYKYTIRHTDVSETQNYTLNSQAEVDAFADSKVTIIEGNLSIATTENAADPITNLNGLSALTEVLDDFTIGNYYKGENLNGLSKLKKVGNMTVLNPGANLDKLTTISFPSLVSVRKQLAINSGQYFEKVSFPLLAVVGGNFTLDAVGMKQFNLNSLKTVTGYFTIKEGQMSQLELPVLETVGDYLSITTDYKNSNLLEINLPQLATCQSIDINKANKLEKLKLPALKSITKGLTLSQCATFNDESIKNTISNITTIGTLRFTDTKIFNLDVRGKEIEEVQLGYLTDEDPSKQITITGNEPFGNINFAARQMAPPTLKGFTTVKDYILATNIKEGLTIKDIKRINGSLNVSYLTEQGMATSVLYDIHLPDLEYAGNIEINSLGENVKTTAFEAPKLETITSDITFNVHNEQEDFSFIKMANLKAINGMLYIKATSAYSSPINKLNIKEIFPKLERLSNVYIWGFPELYNFSSFKSFIDNGMITKWKVSYCGFKPTLQQMKDSSTGDFTNQ